MQHVLIRVSRGMHCQHGHHEWQRCRLAILGTEHVHRVRPRAGQEQRVGGRTRDGLSVAVPLVPQSCRAAAAEHIARARDHRCRRKRMHDDLHGIGAADKSVGPADRAEVHSAAPDGEMARTVTGVPAVLDERRPGVQRARFPFAELKRTIRRQRRAERGFQTRECYIRVTGRDGVAGCNQDLHEFDALRIGRVMREQPLRGS